MSVLGALEFKYSTLKCLSIGTLIIIDFPFVPNGKSMVLGVQIFKPNIFRLQFCLNLGTYKNT